MPRLGVPLTGVFVLLAVISRADWPQFRHDAAHTGVADDFVSPPLELKWQFVDVPDLDPKDEVPPERERQLRGKPGLILGPGGFGAGRPVLLAGGDAVFLNRKDSGETCLDAATGEVRWHDPTYHRLIAVSGPALVCTNLVSYVEGRGAMRSEEVWQEVAVCNAATGQPVWTVDGDDIGLSLRSDGCQGCVVRDDLVCLSTRWMYAPDDSRPLRDRPRARGPYQCLFNLASGLLVKTYLSRPPDLPDPRRFTASPFECVTVEAWDGDVMLLRHGRNSRSEPYDPNIAPPWLLASDGSLLPMPPGEGEGITPGPGVVPNEPPPHWALSEGLGVAVGAERTAQRRLRLAAREVTTGRLLWQRPIEGSFALSLPPVLAASGVYVGLLNGYVAALDPLTGETKWETQIGEEQPPDGPIAQAHCSLSGDTLWVVYDGRLAALDAKTGEVLWQTDKTEAAWHEPVIHKGMIYLLTCRGVEAWGTGGKDQPATGKGEGEDR
jgi:outer membrane protein assembly factor BamB